MFKKCLKYDLRAVWKVWWILAVSVTGLCIVGSLGLRFFIQNVSMGEEPVSTPIMIGSIFAMLLFIASIIALIAFVVVTFILVYYRYYKNLFTDEGYLTFTLPVRRQTLYLSKTLNALIWEVASVVVVVLNVLFALLVVPPSADGLINPVAYRGLSEFLQELWEVAGTWTLVFGLEVLILLLLYGLFFCGLVQMCVTIGSVVAKKHKLLAAVGIYYLVNMVLSFITQFVSLFGMAGLVESMVYLMENHSFHVCMGIISLALLLGCVMLAVVAMILHFITLGQLERKLNLA